MVDQVFQVTGNKIASLLIDEDALKFSSATFDNIESFRASFSKTLSLTSKFDIRYDAIKYVRKEDNSKTIIISHKTSLGIPNICAFTFNNSADEDILFDFLEKVKYFTRNRENMSAFAAARPNLIGLVVTVAISIFSYKQAIEIANGTAEQATSSKARAFNYLVGLLGDKGVLLLGIGISGYLIFNIWKRFSNPPDQVKLLPPGMA